MEGGALSAGQHLVGVLEPGLQAPLRQAAAGHALSVHAATAALLVAAGLVLVIA